VSLPPPPPPPPPAPTVAPPPTITPVRPPTTRPETGATAPATPEAPRSEQPKSGPQPAETAAAPAASATGEGSDQIRRIQAMLTSLGFAPGPADGTLTPTTRDAIREYQRALGLDITGEPSEQLAAHLRQLTGNKN